MQYSVEKDLELCKELVINVRQLMFMKMLVSDSSLTGAENDYRRRRLTLCFQSIGGISTTDIKNLEERKLVVNTDPENDVILYDSFEIVPKITKHFSNRNSNMAEELFEAYPFEIKTEIGYITAKNATPAEIEKEYLRAINNDQKEHKKVLIDLKQAIDGNFLKIGLKKFVGTKYWNHIRTINKTSFKAGGQDVNIG